MENQNTFASVTIKISFLNWVKVQNRNKFGIVVGFQFGLYLHFKIEQGFCLHQFQLQKIIEEQLASLQMDAKKDVVVSLELLVSSLDPVAKFSASRLGLIYLELLGIGFGAADPKCIL